jgi:hypothetical protein
MVYAGYSTRCIADTGSCVYIGMLNKIKSIEYTGWVCISIQSVPVSLSMFVVLDYWTGWISEHTCIYDNIDVSCREQEFWWQIDVLDAPGGTGKTFTLNPLISWMRMEGHEVATSATSSIAAATLLYNGRTPHNRFKLPLHPHKSFCSIKSNQMMQSFCGPWGFDIGQGPTYLKSVLST